MKQKCLILIILVLLAVLVLIAFSIWGVPYFFDIDLSDPTGTGFGAETVRARVDLILEEGTIELGDLQQPYQRLRVEILEGEYRGILMEVDYGTYQVLGQPLQFQPGDEIFVVLSLRTDNRLIANYADVARTRQLIVLAIVFAVAILLISRWKGLRSILALVFSLWVIIGYILPHILQGEDPVRVSIIGSAILLTVTIYLTYGWNFKTHASVLSMLIVLVLTGTLAFLAIIYTRLTGLGSEDALFLLQVPGMEINLRGLVLGGMIIGALGVLDDLVTTQSSAVFELHLADPTLGLFQLYRKAMRIGQDHVSATVNTLVLAYVGASLPMLLLFTFGRGNFAYLLNVELVAEEIVRTLVGSLGLIAAVPIATLIAALFALNNHRLGILRAYLGPETGKHEFDHSHG